jgi:hypothetical protein
MTELFNDKVIGKPLMERLALPVADSLASIFTNIYADAFTASSRTRQETARISDDAVGVKVAIESDGGKQTQLKDEASKANTQPRNVTQGGLFDLETAFAEKTSSISKLRRRWTWEEYEKRRAAERAKRVDPGA